MTEIHGTARIKIKPGKLDEYKRLAAKSMEIVRTRDPGTVEYDIFINEETSAAFVHERFHDSAAGMAHSANQGDMQQQLAKICTIEGEVCGDPSPELTKQLEAFGVKIYRPFVSK